MGIFSEQELSGVRSYSYKGGDLSLCYKYIYSPLTEYLAKYTPSWLAYYLTVGLISSHYWISFQY
jgi:hypothetical protein